MRSLLIILFSFFFVFGYSQPPGNVHDKGYPYFLKDAKGKIIGADIAGAFSALNADTTTDYLVQPPDTIQSFVITMGNPGDESSPPLATGVQAYYSFEETAGGTAYDSAASYDGTLMNTPTQNETGISNLCYSFAEISDEWIDYGTSFWDVGTDDLSISFWIYPIDDAPGHTNGGIMGNFGTLPWFYIRNQPGSTLKGVANFTGSNIETQTNGNLSVNSWYHVVYRWDRDGNATLHLNNVLQTDQDDISAHSAVDVSNSNTFAIGRIGNALANYYHNGRIDEVNIYDRLISVSEISNLYNLGIGKFWPFGVIGGDTVNMSLSGLDARADCVIVNYAFDTYPTTILSGTRRFAFEMADSNDYVDTNFLWNDLKDTIAYFTGWTKLGTEVTDVPNKDTVFIDSSDITPPIQDVGIWDTLFYQDFEQHSGIAPVEYTSQYTPPVGTRPNYQQPDWNNYTWFDSDHRWPEDWAANPKIKDSLVIDGLTGSIVLKESFDDTTMQNYTGTSPARGGDSWTMPLPESGHTELYVSFNVMFRPGWIHTAGGKTGGGFSTHYLQQECPPPYGEGFSVDVQWFPELYGLHGGEVGFYYSYPNMTTCPARTVHIWDDFTPVGEGLNYDEREGDPTPNVYLDKTDSTWYNLTLRCVVNTFTGSTPNEDGLFEGFVNGYLIERHSGLQLLTYPVESLGIQNLYFRCFYGGGPAPAREEWILVDDVIVFTYDEEVDVPRGQELSQPGRVLNLPNWPKE